MTDDDTSSFVDWWLSQGEWASDRPLLAILFIGSQLALFIGVCWMVLW